MFTQLRRAIRNLQASEKHDLAYLFGQADPSRPLIDRIEWIAGLVEWIRDDAGGKTSTGARVKFVLQWLERNPQFREPSAALIRSVLGETSAEDLYIHVGLPSEPSFGREFRRRLWRVFVPEYRDPRDLGGVQARIFYDDEDPQRLASIPLDVMEELLLWLRTGLAEGVPLIPRWRTEVLEAARILAARDLSITLREDVRRRGPALDYDRNPFVRIGAALAAVKDGSPDPGVFETIRAEIGEARKFLLEVRLHLEETGVSVDLVYQLTRVRADLARLTRLIGLLDRDARGEELASFAIPFWAELLRGHEADSDFAEVFDKQVGLLAKKIVERTGATGEHAIARDAGEYRLLFFLAAGGGLITAFTAYIKYMPGEFSRSPFGEFLFHATNYSLSFLIMHWLGFKLATKQPSMTAATLASKLREEGGMAEDDAFVDEIARISRSQFAAVMGNILAVAPVVWCLDTLHRHAVGHSFFSQEKSLHLLESIDPFTTATIFYASVTGVLLWLASMAAGWVENAWVYNRLPEMLRTHAGLRKLLGVARARAIAEYWTNHVAGMTGAVALGVLLAFAPTLGRFLGLPLQAYHVTLTSGAATFSATSLGWEALDAHLIVGALLGIAFIGMMNFTVSFILALSVAVRAKELPRDRVKMVFRRAGARLLRRPHEFFLPQRRELVAGETDSVKSL